MSFSADSRTPPPDAILRYRTEQRESALVVHCIGSMVLPNFLSMDDMLRDIKSSKPKRIILNLQKAERLDSVGVGTLSIILKYAMANGIGLFLVVNENAKQILATSGLDRVFEFAPSVEAALGKSPR